MYVFIVRRKSDDENTDAPDDEMVDGGREWPPNENRDVARYRNFYQVILSSVSLNRKLIVSEELIPK